MIGRFSDHRKSSGSTVGKHSDHRKGSGSTIGRSSDHRKASGSTIGQLSPAASPPRSRGMLGRKKSGENLQPPKSPRQRLFGRNKLDQPSGGEEVEESPGKRNRRRLSLTSKKNKFGHGILLLDDGN